MGELSTIVDAALMYQSIMVLDCSILVCDKEGTIVKSLPAKSFNLPAAAAVGKKIPPGKALEQCLAARQEKRVILEKEVFGVVCKSVAAPIFEDGKLVGALSMITSMETQQVLHESAQTIAATAEEITATTEELASTATQFAQDLESLKNFGEQVIGKIHKTDEILKLVSDVAASSNLLGLNAAIEAARAGEHGRGFAVVAEEIRKMADHSAKSAKDIKVILRSIQSDVSEIVKTISQTAQIGESQAAAAEQISASVEQLASSAVEVEKIAEIA